MRGVKLDEVQNSNSEKYSGSDLPSCWIVPPLDATIGLRRLSQILIVWPNQQISDHTIERVSKPRRQMTICTVSSPSALDNYLSAILYKVAV